MLGCVAGRRFGGGSAHPGRRAFPFLTVPSEIPHSAPSPPNCQSLEHHRKHRSPAAVARLGDLRRTSSASVPGGGALGVSNRAQLCPSCVCRSAGCQGSRHATIMPRGVPDGVGRAACCPLGDVGEVWGPADAAVRSAPQSGTSDSVGPERGARRSLAAAARERGPPVAIDAAGRARAGLIVRGPAPPSRLGGTHRGDASLKRDAFVPDVALQVRRDVNPVTRAQIA